jgi:hypothetical protein
MPDSNDTATSKDEMRLAKWSEEQTAQAAEHYGVAPEDLTHDHFADLDWAPAEEIRIDHVTGKVIHLDSQGNRRVLTIEEWNREEH